MHIEGSHSGNNLVVRDVNNVQSQSSEKYEEEIKKLQMEIELLKEKNVRAPEPGNFVGSENDNLLTDDKVIEIHEDQGAISYPVDVALGTVHNEDAQSSVVQNPIEYADNHEDALPKLLNNANTHSAFENIENISEQNVGQQAQDSGLLEKSDSVSDELIYKKTEVHCSLSLRISINIILVGFILFTFSKSLVRLNSWEWFWSRLVLVLKMVN